MLVRKRFPLGLDAHAAYNGQSERLKVVCDHYLDLGLGLREVADEIVIWPCPSCGGPSFVARLEEGVAGCTEEGCEVPSAMDLPDLVAYLDDDLEPTDRRAANKRFAGLFEAALGRQRRLEEDRKERRQLRRLTREEKHRKKDSSQARDSSEEEYDRPQDHLF